MLFFAILHLQYDIGNVLYLYRFGHQVTQTSTISTEGKSLEKTKCKNVVQVRLSDGVLTKLRYYVARNETSMSTVIRTAVRNFVQRIKLPKDE